MRRAIAPISAVAVLFSLILTVPASAISVPTTTTPRHAPTSPPQSSAKKLLSTADHNAEAQKWVHETIVTNEAGITNTTTVATLGTETMSARVTTSGVRGSGTYSIIDLLKTNREYVKGSAAALSTIDPFTFTSEEAPDYAGKWVKLPPTITEEETRVSGSTIGEQFRTLVIPGPGKLSSTRYAGRAVNVITYEAYGIGETIYISEGPKPLPLAYTITASGVSDHLAWSDWGHGSAPAAPADPLPFPITPTPPTTPTTLPASAGFCSDVATLGAAYSALVAAGTTKTATVAEYTAQLNALTTGLAGIVTDLGSVIATAPTTDISLDYTVLLGYANALTTTLSLINAAVAALPAGATVSDLETAIIPFELRAILDATVIQFTKPTTEAASVFCPAPTPTTTTTTTPTS